MAETMERKKKKRRKKVTPVSHHDTVVTQWLIENFELYETASVGRGTVYEHYTAFCPEAGIEPLNAATFGKLLRNFYPSVTTRRLGTRGNSKYHYYGIGIKPSSKLLTSAPLPSMPSTSRESTQGDISASASPSTSSIAFGLMDPSPLMLPRNYSSELPEFLPTFPGKLSPYTDFGYMYSTHCQQLVDIIGTQKKYDDVKQLLTKFWTELPPLIRTELNSEELAQEIRAYDHVVYSAIISGVLPHVLADQPVSVAQQLREFSKLFEGWLALALDGQSGVLVHYKLQAAREFGSTIRRFAALNHLAQAARAILQNPRQMGHMKLDWNKVDFVGVRERSRWLCASGVGLIEQLQTEFATILERHGTVEIWARWLEDVILRFHERCGSLNDVVETSQQLLIKWSYYCSLIMHDLTIRNAPSFGCFHLLRTLFEEYMHYFVEKQLTLLIYNAKAAQEAALGGQSPSSAADAVQKPDVGPRKVAEDVAQMMSPSTGYQPFAYGRAISPVIGKSGGSMGLFPDYLSRSSITDGGYMDDGTPTTLPEIRRISFEARLSQDLGLLSELGVPGFDRFVQNGQRRSQIFASDLAMWPKLSASQEAAAESDQLKPENKDSTSPPEVAKHGEDH